MFCLNDRNEFGMKKIVTCEKMKELDSGTISRHGMDSLVLMERASLAVTDCLEEKKETLKRVLCVCGMGNNGGDGIAVARILRLRGYDSEIFLVGNPEHMTPETKKQCAIAASYQVPFVNNPAWEEYTTIVDAVFGVGLKREITGIYKEVIENLNRQKGRKVAVDIPSGIHGDTGQVMGTAFAADETVTFAYGKKGLYLYPGGEFTGKITVADIGIYAEKGERFAAEILEEEDAARWLPKRSPSGNKGTFGKVLLVVSAPNMAGAGYLCARSCFAMGAGMVKIHTAEENRLVYQTSLPEAMVSVQKKGSPDLSLLEKDLEWCDVVAAGPGLGTGDGSCRLVEYLLDHCQKPMVLDADALNLLAANPQWKDKLGNHCVVTPHLGEMGRLLGMPSEKIRASAREEAMAFGRETGAVCVLKDARTWIGDDKGNSYLNVTGNAGMGTAGSGDVLCGVIAGLLAGGLPPEKSAPLGVFLHGLAGDEARKKKGQRGMMAGDIAGCLIDVLKRIEDK